MSPILIRCASPKNIQKLDVEARQFLGLKECFRGPYAAPSTPPEPTADVVRQKRKTPGQNTHVKPLKERPFPGIGFPPHNGNGAHTLQREYIKHHQGDSRQTCVNR